MSTGGNPEMKVEFQMVGNKQQVVWASFKLWVTLKMRVGFFKESFPLRISMHATQQKVGI